MFLKNIVYARRRQLLRRLGLLTTTVLMLMLTLPDLALAQEGPTVADLSLAMDTVWVIVAAVLRLFIQKGVATHAGGVSPMKNVGRGGAKRPLQLPVRGRPFLGR